MRSSIWANKARTHHRYAVSLLADGITALEWFPRIWHQFGQNANETHTESYRMHRREMMPLLRARPGSSSEESSFMTQWRTVVMSALVATLACIVSSAVRAQPAPADGMNAYVLRAVDKLYKESPNKGYNIARAYSKEISYGSGVIRPSEPPLTMCVAAVAEVMITAINLYVVETGDNSPYAYLPPDGWNRMRPRDIRSHIWVAPQLDSYGTADAFVTYGIGRRVKFSELSPGSFVNLNRTNKSGHAVVFLSYVDKSGNNVAMYSSTVAGFRYFSAQGVGRSPNAGFGYRIAFFTHSDGTRVCPDRTADGTKRDCDVIYKLDQKYLNTGYLQAPKYWNATQRDANLKALAAGLYKQSRSRGPEFLGFPSSLSETEFYSRLDEKDTLKLNPKLQNANRTTDDD
jgi:hypothetical protein